VADAAPLARDDRAGDPEPIGMIAAVFPWFTPLAINVQKVVPTIRHRLHDSAEASIETPSDAYFLAELLAEAGLRACSTSCGLTERPAPTWSVTRVWDKVTFTGSTAAGRSIEARCGLDLRLVTVELEESLRPSFCPTPNLDHSADAMGLGSPATTVRSAA
jgi:aldehyde dehydrogenase (NAD+)